MKLSEVKRAVNEALDKKKLVILVGRCRVKYEGRAASKLSEGDRLLVIKPDGTFLVHQSTKMSAINYQGPGARITSAVKNRKLVVIARRRKPLTEIIEVEFSRVDYAGSHEMQDDKKLRLFGSEKQLSGLIMQDLHLIEGGLKPLKRESTLNKGAVDILAEDKLGHLVAIEVKRRDAGLAAVTQLNRYVKELRKRKGGVVRGILCSPHITSNALKMLEQEGLEYYKLDYEIGNPSAKIKGLQKKQKALGEY